MPDFTDFSRLGDVELYLPSVNACWDYGLQRVPKANVPFLSSFGPYKFLRGIQFDSKVFQTSELLTYFGSFFGNSEINDDVILEVVPTSENKINNPERVLTWGTNSSGQRVPNLTSRQADFTGSNNALNLSKIKIRIAPNWQDNLPVTHSHNWGAPNDMISGLLKQVGGGIRNLSQLVQSARQGGGATDAVYIDSFIDRYQNTNKQKLTIPFTLFTRNNFVLDILLPILWLNSLTYPQITPETERLQEDVQGILDGNAEALIRWGNRNVVRRLNPELASGIGDRDLSAVVSTFAERVGMRGIYAQPPPQFNVKHTSGLLLFKRACIEEFSYTFKGPWIKQEHEGLLGLAAGVANGEIGDVVNRLVNDVYLKKFSFPDRTYPVQAECRITLRELEQVTAEDWMPLIGDLLNTGTALKEVLVNGGNAPVAGVVAAGVLNSLPSVLPNIRKQPSGNNWVPPGESLTGVPGLL
jgi:hypothetical protein